MPPVGLESTAAAIWGSRRIGQLHWTRVCDDADQTGADGQSPATIRRPRLSVANSWISLALTRLTPELSTPRGGNNPARRYIVPITMGKVPGWLSLAPTNQARPAIEMPSGKNSRISLWPPNLTRLRRSFERLTARETKNWLEVRAREAGSVRCFPHWALKGVNA